MSERLRCRSRVPLTAAFVMIMCAVIIITVFVGCNSQRRQRPVIESNSEMEESMVSLAVSRPPENGELMYVTGVQKTISLKEADDNDAKAVAQLNLGDAVEYIDDESTSYYYVAYTNDEGREIKGYIKKDYLTKEKNAVCKRTDMYIAKNTFLKNYDNVNIKEMKTNDAVFLISKNSGDYWYIYHKGSKMFGYVLRNALSEKKIKDKKSETNSAPVPVYTGPYTGYSDTPPKEYETYYVYGVKQYLAIRSDMDYNSYNELSRAYYGETIFVINKNTGNKYWYCYAPSSRYYGYADSGYLNNRLPTPEALFERYYVSGVSDYLSLRETAGSSGYEKGKMKNGDEVRVIDKNTGSKYWFCYSVNLNDFGYADSRYLSKTKSKTPSSKIESSKPVSSKPESSKLEKEYPTGYSSTPPKTGYDVYYVEGVVFYLAVRSEQVKVESNVLYQARNAEEIYVIDTDTGSQYWYCYSPKGCYYGFVDSNYLSPYPPVIESETSSEDSAIEDIEYDDSSMFDSSTSESSAVSEASDFGLSSLLDDFGDLIYDDEWYDD